MHCVVCLVILGIHLRGQLSFSVLIFLNYDSLRKFVIGPSNYDCYYNIVVCL